jgi:hypothetical protein
MRNDKTIMALEGVRGQSITVYFNALPQHMPQKGMRKTI